MKLHYFDREPNFGDALNGWIWDRIAPGWLDNDARVRVSGIGTLLGDAMPSADRWIVVSSGVGYSRLPTGADRARWTVVAVRGPLSALALALPPSAAVTDGAVLLATLPEYAAVAESGRQGIVFVPHHRSDATGGWRQICAAAGVDYVDPAGGSREIVGRLQHARLVLAEAMHAAIIADSVRVPWVPVVTSARISTFKWLDWTASMALPYRPVRLPAPTALDRAAGVLLRLAGESHAFTPGSAGQALGHLHRRDRLLGRPWWPAARHLGRSLSARLVRELRKPRHAGWQRGVDPGLGERAAAALARAVQGPGYLSDDGVFADRRDELLERVRRASRADAPDAHTGSSTSAGRYPALS